MLAAGDVSLGGTSATQRLSDKGFSNTIYQPRPQGYSRFPILLKKIPEILVRSFRSVKTVRVVYHLPKISGQNEKYYKACQQFDFGHKLAIFKSSPHLNTRNSYVLRIFPELERNGSSMNIGTIPHLL